MDTTYVMKDYRPEKDYMFRIRAGNEYGVSDPSMSSTLFAKSGKWHVVKDGTKQIASQVW